jgi:hypothetical protein
MKSAKAGSRASRVGWSEHERNLHRPTASTERALGAGARVGATEVVNLRKFQEWAFVITPTDWRRVGQRESEV